MPLPVLTPPPEVPSLLNNPADFVARAEAWLAWQAVNRSEMAAWALALPANITGTDFKDNSTSSVLIGTGDKTFTVTAGKGWQIGQAIRVAYTTTPTNYMDGVVKSYTGTTLVVTVGTTNGSGTWAVWSISLSPGSGNYITPSSTDTLTNKTITGNIAASFQNGGFTITLPTATTTLVGHNTTNTLTNKTISFANNTVTMTLAELNAALSDADVMTLAGTQTATGKTFTAPTINGGAMDGAQTVGDTSIATNSVGFRAVPKSANATGTLVLADNGKFIDMAGNWTIPANASVAFPIGAVIEFVNDTASTRTISITTDTMYWDGTGSTGTRTLAARGRCWVQKTGATTWYISGSLTA